ncbi:MAG TPA: hypothetical protein VJK54_03695 [Chthoniobacterales bacterium]|nr:hypothetical protein [Chthoniobacterales bacterium]
MKVFFPLLIGAFISFSNLNSQVEPIRIQDIGEGEQGKNRLKTEGYRQENADQRSKLEGCGLQKVEDGVINEGEYNLNKKALLLKKDSIPIFHLLSSSSYLGVTPKLMMDPSSVEEGITIFGNIIDSKNLSSDSITAASGSVALSTPWTVTASSVSVIAEFPAQNFTEDNQVKSLKSDKEARETVCKYSGDSSIEYSESSTNHEGAVNCACNNKPQLPSSISYLPSPAAAAAPPITIRFEAKNQLKKDEFSPSAFRRLPSYKLPRTEIVESAENSVWKDQPEAAEVAQARELWEKALVAKKESLEDVSDIEPCKAPYPIRPFCFEKEKAHQIAQDTYDKAYAAIKPLLLAAEKANKITKAAYEEANATALEKTKALNVAWNDVIQQTKIEELAWDQLIQAYTNARDTIPKSKLADWDELLNAAKYYKTEVSTIKPLLLEALKVTKIANAAYNEAKSRRYYNKSCAVCLIDAIQKNQTAQLAWDQVIQAYAQAKDMPPLTCKAYYDNNFNTAQYCKALYAIRPLCFEAVKANKIAKNAYTIANAYPNDPISESNKAAWNDAIQKTKIEELARDQVVQAYSDAQRTIPQGKQANWINCLNIAKYEKTCTAIESLWFAAEKAGKIANTARNQANLTSYEDTEAFETAWNDTMQKTETWELAWDQVVQAYTNARDTIPQSNQTNWDDRLNEAHYYKTYAAARLLFFQTEKAKAIALTAHNNALITSPKDPEAFEVAWSDAIQQAKALELAWEQVLQTYLRDKDEIPKKHQQTWNELLIHAENKKNRYAAQPALLEAEKAEKQAAKES